VRALVENPNYDQVSIVWRRKRELPRVSDEPGYAKINQMIINFDDPSTYAETFKGFDVGFCALGITSGGVSKEDYYRITTTTSSIQQDKLCLEDVNISMSYPGNVRRKLPFSIGQRSKRR